jgi:protein phosphatase
MRHVLTNVLGARDDTPVHVSEHELHDGDQILLCSDGVHGVLSEADMAARLLDATELQRTAQDLIQAAIEGGSRDNLTVVLVTEGNEG